MTMKLPEKQSLCILEISSLKQDSNYIEAKSWINTIIKDNNILHNES